MNAARPPRPKRIDLQGHRGARGLLPENTLPAFSRAIEIGVDTLELDCALTRDRVVVVAHDAALNPEITRDAAGRWLEKSGPAIWQLTYDELRQYDVGRIRPDSEYARRFPRQQALDGVRIPRLADVFDSVSDARATGVRFNIETKVSPVAPAETADPETFTRALLDVIDTSGMAARVSVESFHWETLALVQRLAPAIPTVCLTAEQHWTDNICRRAQTSQWTAPHHVSHHGGSLPAMVRAAGGQAWSPNFEEVTVEGIAEAHALALQVIVWTVNDEHHMRRMADLGVDGIMSDYPDALVRLFRTPA